MSLIGHLVNQWFEYGLSKGQLLDEKTISLFQVGILFYRYKFQQGSFRALNDGDELMIICMFRVFR